MDYHKRKQNKIFLERHLQSAQLPTISSRQARTSRKRKSSSLSTPTWLSRITTQRNKRRLCPHRQHARTRGKWTARGYRSDVAQLPTSFSKTNKTWQISSLLNHREFCLAIRLAHWFQAFSSTSGSYVHLPPNRNESKAKH